MDKESYYLSQPSPPMHSLIRASTDPIWIQHHLLKDGHTKNVPNGTVTFIKRKGLFYLVTCRHVIDAAQGNDVPALMINNIVLNISSRDQDGALRHNFRFPDKDNLDVAIYRLTDYHWSLFAEKKGKIAIDLDNWNSPLFDDEYSYIAAGYPTAHKTDQGTGQVGAPLVLATAEAASDITPDSNNMAIHSSMDIPHGWYFSGMSGGPIFQVKNVEELALIALIFEGGPSTNDTELASIFYGPNDIFFRGTIVTPDIFDRWLDMTGYR